MTKRERLKDESVLAAIIAGGEGNGRRVLPSLGERAGIGTGGHGFGKNADGPCCAVGAGILFAGLAIGYGSSYNTFTFADVHGVSYQYAKGVSDGFEYTDLDGFNPAEDKDYDRGVEVGIAAFDYFGSNGRA